MNQAYIGNLRTTNENYLPPACEAATADSTAGAPVPPDPYAGWGPYQIKACTYAMIELIDIRFARYEDSVLTMNSNQNTFFDASVIGMGAAGTLVGGPTSQILNAASSAVTGFKAKIDSDILYSKSITIILQQMRTNRATQLAAIQAKLNPNTGNGGQGYANMYDAAIDLYRYARAGSWTEALLNLEAATGAQAQQCALQTTQNQIAAAGYTTGGSGAGVGSGTTAAPTKGATAGAAAPPPPAPGSSSANNACPNTPAQSQPVKTGGS
jgi:hypothetical protein